MANPVTPEQTPRQKLAAAILPHRAGPVTTSQPKQTKSVTTSQPQQAKSVTDPQSQSEPPKPSPATALPCELLFMVFPRIMTEEGRFVRVRRPNTSSYCLAPNPTSPTPMQLLRYFRDWTVTTKFPSTRQKTDGARGFQMYFNHEIATAYLEFGPDSFFQSICLRSLTEAISTPERKRIQHLVMNFYQGWGKKRGTEDFAKDLALLPGLKKLTIFAHKKGDFTPVLCAPGDVCEYETQSASLAKVNLTVDIALDIVSWWHEVQRFRGTLARTSPITMEYKRVEVRNS